MKIISNKIEVFYTNKEIDSNEYQKHHDDLIKEGYEYLEGYNAVHNETKGFVVEYIKHI